MAYAFIDSCLWPLWSHDKWWLLVTETACGSQSLTYLLSGFFQNNFAALWPKIPFLYLTVVGFCFLSLSSSLLPRFRVFFNVWFLCIILLEKPQRAFLLKPMVFLFYHHTFGVVWRVNVCKDSRWSNSKVAEPLKGGMSRPRVMEGMPLKGIMGLWSLNFPSLLLRSLGLWLVHRVSLPWYAALTRSHKSWAGTSATSIQNSQAVFPLQVNCSKVFC